MNLTDGQRRVLEYMAKNRGSPLVGPERCFVLAEIAQARQLDRDDFLQVDFLITRGLVQRLGDSKIALTAAGAVVAAEIAR